MTLTDGAELYICLILTIEFGYDYWWNSRENRIKRRKQREKTQKPRNEAQERDKTHMVAEQGTPGNP